MSKVRQNSVALKNRQVVSVISIKAFQNGLCQIRDVCSFEDIGQSLFHAKLCKCK